MKLTKMYPNWFKSLKKEENPSAGFPSNEKIHQEALGLSFHNPIHGGDPLGNGNPYGTYTSEKMTPNGFTYHYPGGVTAEHKDWSMMSAYDHLNQAKHHINQAELKERYPGHYPGAALSHRAAATHHAARAAYMSSPEYINEPHMRLTYINKWTPKTFKPVHEEKLLPGSNGGSTYTFKGTSRDGEPIKTTIAHWLGNGEPMNLRNLRDVNAQFRDQFQSQAEDAYKNPHHSDPQKNHEAVVSYIAASRAHRDAADIIDKIISAESGGNVSDNSKYLREKFLKRFDFSLPFPDE